MHQRAISCNLVRPLPTRARSSFSEIISRIRRDDMMQSQIRMHTASPSPSGCSHSTVGSDWTCNNKLLVPNHSRLLTYHTCIKTSMKYRLECFFIFVSRILNKILFKYCPRMNQYGKYTYILFIIVIHGTHEIV